MAVQIVKVMEKSEWPKIYVWTATGDRVRFFSKSDVPPEGYVLEADWEKAKAKEAVKKA